MNPHSTYDTLRHLADSWGLVATMILFLGLVAWPFRPGAKEHNEAAANSIFAEEDPRGNEHDE